MQIMKHSGGREDEIACLFRDTFTDSEGAEEGRMIHDLARDLLLTTPPDDLRVYIVQEENALCGCAIFSRLRFADEPRIAFLLSPMAVATAHQGKGVGQDLLNHALKALQAEGVAIAVTYGDPNFYGRVGFEPVTTDTVPSPQPLNIPEGWIAQSLTDEPLTPLSAPACCAPALNNPEFW